MTFQTLERAVTGKNSNFTRTNSQCVFLRFITHREAMCCGENPMWRDDGGTTPVAEVVGISNEIIRHLPGPVTWRSDLPTNNTGVASTFDTTCRWVRSRWGRGRWGRWGRWRRHTLKCCKKYMNFKSKCISSEKFSCKYTLSHLKEFLKL